MVVTRTGNGWSGPSFIGTGGAGWGLQVGAQVNEFVVVLNTNQAVRAFSRDGNVSLGVDVSAAAGPVGRNLQAERHSTRGSLHIQQEQRPFRWSFPRGRDHRHAENRERPLLRTPGECDGYSLRSSRRTSRSEPAQRRLEVSEIIAAARRISFTSRVVDSHVRRRAHRFLLPPSFSRPRQRAARNSRRENSSIVYSNQIPRCRMKPKARSSSPVARFRRRRRRPRSFYVANRSPEKQYTNVRNANVKDFRTKESPLAQQKANTSSRTKSAKIDDPYPTSTYDTRRAAEAQKTSRGFQLRRHAVPSSPRARVRSR